MIRLFLYCLILPFFSNGIIVPKKKTRSDFVINEANLAHPRGGQLTDDLMPIGGLLSNPMKTHYSDAVRHRMTGNADRSSLDLLGGSKPPLGLGIPFSAASQSALKGSSNDEFDMQRYDRLKQQRKYRRDQKAVVGSNSDNTIKSGRKTVDLFVFRIHNDIEDDNVKAYIAEKVSLDRFQKMSNCEAPMKSYKFSINADDENEVMNPEFWPKGVRCRRFIYKRQISEPSGFNRGSADIPTNG